jgi:Eukaryotic protein of unknown function (DUF829)
MPKKPLVVIAGWLGCREGYLRRYQHVYEQLGMDVWTVIAPPLAIVEASFVPKNERNQMDTVAMVVLSHIEESHRKLVLFHLFSNGGCFLWEMIRYRMDLDQSFSFSVVGVVFDSCPAWFGNQVSALSSALDLCTEDDKRAVRDRFGDSVVGKENDQHARQRKQRNKDFFEFLQRDLLDVPHLYFFCKNDLLADASRIEEVIWSRRRQFHRPIFHRMWKTSVHCSHILQHPREYKEFLSDFVTIAMHCSTL